MSTESTILPQFTPNNFFTAKNVTLNAAKKETWTDIY